MFNVCPACGVYSVDKAIDPAGPFAVCPHCNHAHRFQRLPLFVVTGASGAGKTPVCLHLPAHLTECVVLESDILWRPEFDTPETEYAAYRDLWLRLAKNIGQSGRPVVLGGSALPHQFAASPEHRYFASLHYLALVCDDAVLAARLRARPAWREAGADAFIERMQNFNGWLRANAGSISPPLTLLDTTEASTEETVSRVAAWVRGLLPHAADARAAN
jgi:hypothetical protein